MLQDIKSGEEISLVSNRTWPASDQKGVIIFLKFMKKRKKWKVRKITNLLTPRSLSEL